MKNESKTCCFNQCQFSPFLGKESLVSYDDGEKLLVLCRNDLIIHTLFHNQSPSTVTPYPSQLTQPLGGCDACSKQGTVLYQTFDDNGNSLSLTFCQNDLIRFISSNLTKRGFFNLKEKHGIFFEIHDDFYDENGTALQPRQ